MARQSFAHIIADREQLLVTVAANEPDLASIAEYRAQLEIENEGAKAANIRRSGSKAETQQATRDLEGFLLRGRDLAERIRTGLRSRYGATSEKLTEFGIRPRRKPVRKAKTETPEPALKPIPASISEAES